MLVKEDCIKEKMCEYSSSQVTRLKFVKMYLFKILMQWVRL